MKGIKCRLPWGCVFIHPSIHLSRCLALSFLFCYVVNTSNHIPEINTALDWPATLQCNNITHTHIQKQKISEKNIKTLQAIATQKNTRGHTLKTKPFKHTQSVPCGACKWAHSDVSKDLKLLCVCVRSHRTAGPDLYVWSDARLFCLYVCRAGHVCNWSQTVSHMPLWCQPTAPTLPSFTSHAQKKNTHTHMSSHKHPCIHTQAFPY